MTATSSDLVAAINGGARVCSHRHVLGNGLEVVVLPYGNRGSVLHAVWYRVGSADDPPGKTGLAHLLEHLMDKTTVHPSGVGREQAFSKTVERLGAEENAFTEFDATAYHQEIAPEHLGTVMALEADRMVNLHLTDVQVDKERQVVLEERLQEVENDPYEVLYEQMTVLMCLAHPYSAPVDGWAHDVEGLTRADVLAFYRRRYAPNNALVMVAGDVDVDEVFRLAEATYGQIEPRAGVACRDRASEPPHRAAREVVLRDRNAGGSVLLREYMVPTYATAEPGEAEALDVLCHILAESENSRLSRVLVNDEEIATEVEGQYSSHQISGGRLTLEAVAEDDVDMEDLKAAFERVILDVRTGGVTDDEVERAKVTLLADFIYRSDSAARLARLYGRRLIGGETLQDIEAWPERIAGVTALDVHRVAQKYLDRRRSVTGYLLPEAEEALPVA